jgi:8-amino-3,8-dideoxy-alpha-D-manno-octulosonate transaminase
MPGFEIFGKEEREAINQLFDQNGGILFAHGFDALRKGIYKVREFEKAFASKMNVSYAQAVTSGSAALLVALKALGIKQGDEVITQCFTFVATCEAIIECGAIPVFTEIDDTFNMDPKDLEKKITLKTKAIIPVHMAGVAARMDELIAIAKKKNIPILEDTAQAVGGSYKGKALGTIGTVGAFSFDFGKCLTTGEGGMVVSNNEEIYKKARAFHDHGHDYNPVTGRSADDTASYGSGMNYRMTDLHAAIGIVQIGKLDFIINEQRKNKAKLKAEISQLQGLQFRTLPDPNGDCADTLLFTLDTQEKAIKFVDKLKSKGLGTKNVPDALKWHFSGNWDHMLEGKFGYKKLPNLWPKSFDLIYRSVALPIMVKMTDERIQQIASAVKEINKSL